MQQWSHVAALWDGREMRTYLNGQHQQALAFVGQVQATRPVAGLRMGTGERRPMTRPSMANKKELTQMDARRTSQFTIALRIGVFARDN